MGRSYHSRRACAEATPILIRSLTSIDHCSPFQIPPFTRLFSPVITVPRASSARHCSTRSALGTGVAFGSVAAVMSLTKLGPSGWRYFAEEIATGREDYFARSTEHPAATSATWQRQGGIGRRRCHRHGRWNGRDRALGGRAGVSDLPPSTPTRARVTNLSRAGRVAREQPSCDRSFGRLDCRR